MSSDLAPYGARVLALILDSVIVGVALGVLFLVLGAAGTHPTGIAIFAVASLANTLLYAPPLLCRRGARNGQTLGKQALSIRVVREDAAPFTLGTALLREVVGKGVLGVVPFFTIVDYLFPLGDARSQAIHDKLASTFVVRADAVPSIGEPPAPGRRSSSRSTGLPGGLEG